MAKRRKLDTVRLTTRDDPLLPFHCNISKVRIDGDRSAFPAGTSYADATCYRYSCCIESGARMERKNYLNFDEPFLDKLVYRYMKLDKFFMLF